MTTTDDELMTMTQGPIQTDVAIIGAGPTALFAAFECGMLKLSCVLVDALDEVGGQCAALYPEKPIYDIPAHPSIEGGALIEALEQQIAPFDVPRLLGQRVEALEGYRGAFTLRTSAGNILQAKAVIIAAGAGAFGPNRPPLEGLAGYETSGAIQYYVRRRADFAGKRIVVAGGGDSALDWALSLSELAGHVYLLHRRDRFRGAPETLSQIEARVAEGRIEKIVPYQLHGLRGDGSTLAGVEVIDLDGNTRTLDADTLLPFYGLSTDLGPIANWDIQTVRSTVPVSPSTMETSLAGVFAIGDVATYPGKLKLILQGFSEGAMAAHAIHPIVHPDVALHFEYSTSKGVPASS